MTEDLDPLEERFRRECDPQRTSRLPLWGLRKAEHVTSRGQAATHLALPRNTVAAWLRYRDGGLDALWTYQEAGAPGAQKPLPPAVFAPLKARLVPLTGFATSLAIQQWLRKAFALEGP